MALVLSDRVKETTTTTGTSDFVLGGAVTGFQTFSAGVGNSNTTYYAVSLGADFEVGLGTLSGDGLTLARTTVLQSSNSDTKVSFAAGSKEVFVTYPADKAVFEDASGNVSLPLNLTVAGGSTTDSLQLDLSAAITPAVGQIAWDAAQGTASLGLLGGNIISRLGQSLVAYVTNAESVTITKGQAVYLFSAQGDRATVKLAYNTGDATSAKTLGIVGEDITANGTGFVVCQGVAYGLNLSAFTAGDTLYLGSTAGAITATKPYAPNHLVYIGVVEKANAGAGQLYVRVQNGYELDELHNVSAQSPSNGQTIVYNSSTNLWEKNTVSLTAGVNGTLPVANGGTGITSFGSGVATFLGTPSSANLASAVTDETGTGALVFANTPTLVTPILGTPTSATLTNATGLPLTTGVTGTLPIANGGTNATNAADALTSLGAYPATNPSGYTSNTGTVTSVGGTGTVNGISLSGTVTTSGSLTLGGTLSGVDLTTQVTGTLPVANGGTGATTLTANNVILGNGTSAPLFVAPSTIGNVLTSNGTTWASTAPVAGFSTSANNTFTGTQTFSGTSSATAIVLNDAAEVATVSATAATGTIAYDITTQSVLYYTSNASANWTVNFRASSGTSLDTLMSTGQSMTVAFLVTNGATAYYNNVVQVDGTTSGVTTRWLGGAPTAGNASGIDSYRYLLIKTGSATFTVLASNTQFKA